MGCKASSEYTDSDRGLNLTDEASDELVRTVSKMSVPARIKTRAKDSESVELQRIHSTGSVVAGSGRQAIQKQLSRRMSKLPSDARSKMIDTIKKVADDRTEHKLGLESRLSSFGMSTKEMDGDGNCQFRSFAFNLFGEQNHHAVTRKAAITHMEKHKDFFAMFFESPGEFKKYLRDMARPKTWGDELTLRAVVEAYGCEAHVVTSEPANWYLVYQPESQDQDRADPKVALCPKGCEPPKLGKQIFLSYVSPIHYNSIISSSKSLRGKE